jgi:hypothetical protein
MTASLSPWASCTLEEQTANNTSSHCQTTDNSNTHQALLGNLVINQLPQTLSLQIVRLQIDEQLIVATSLCIRAKLVVSESEIVKTFATAVGWWAEDFGEQAYAFLLFLSLGGFDKTPGKVEFCLERDVFALFFVLRA